MFDHHGHGHTEEEGFDSGSGSGIETGDPVKQILKAFLIAFIVIVVFIAICIWLTQPSVITTAAFLFVYLILFPTNTACSTNRLEYPNSLSYQAITLIKSPSIT